MARGFTLAQRLEGKRILKKFRKDRADVSNGKKTKKKGYCCPSK